MLKMVEGYQEPKHSAPPQQLNDKLVWTPASYEANLEKLECDVHGKLSKTSSLTERVNQLQNTIQRGVSPGWN